MLKKYIAAILSVITIISIIAVPVCASETMYVCNVKDSVYLRKSPGSGSYYTTIPVGTAVLSIGWQKGSDGIGYNQVVYNGQKGWVKSEYIKKSSSSNVVTSAEQAKQIVRQRKKLSGNYTITAKDMGSYYLVNVKKSGSEYSCHVSKETGAISNEAGGGV